MSILKRFVRTALLLALALASSTLCLAQKTPPQVVGVPEPPPPARAREYDTSNWMSFRPEPFISLSMPGEPTSSERQIKNDSGPVTEHIYTLTSGAISYRFSYFDSGVEIKEAEAKEMLDDVRDNALAANKGMRLLKESEFKIGGYTGREILVDSGAGYVIHERLFILNRSFYQMIVAAPYNVAFVRGRPDPNDLTDFYRLVTKRFFDSFHVMNGGSVEMPRGAAGSSQAKPAGLLVLNGRALSLPRPIYPSEAKAQGISGPVTVEVLVNETGRVVTAKAVAGPAELRAAAEEAALKARLEPTKLDGRPVNVRGMLVYNFVP